MSDNSPILVYDGECPVCRNYIQMVRIRESVGDMQLINARDGGEIVDSITRQGIDLDQGMVLIMNGITYDNSDTIHALALISTPSNIANRINYWVFKSEARAHFLYPVLRYLRGLLLAILGITKIRNLGAEK